MRRCKDGTLEDVTLLSPGRPADDHRPQPERVATYLRTPIPHGHHELNRMRSPALVVKGGPRSQISAHAVAAQLVSSHVFAAISVRERLR
jgi:hypothetical protein